MIDISESQAKDIVQGMVYHLGFSSMYIYEPYNSVSFVKSSFVQNGADYDGVRCPVIISEDQYGLDYYCFKVPVLSSCWPNIYSAILDAMLEYAKRGKWVLCIDVTDNHVHRCIAKPGITIEELMIESDLSYSQL